VDAVSDGAIRHASPHPPAPEDKHKCGGCRLQAEVDRLRRIEAAARRLNSVATWSALGRPETAELLAALAEPVE